MGNSSSNANLTKVAIKNAVTSGDLALLKEIFLGLGGDASVGDCRSAAHGQGRLEAREALTAASVPAAPSAAAKTLDAGGCGSCVSLGAKDWLHQPLNRKGDTALILASRTGNYHLLPFLLQIGCHVNAVNRNNETALDVMLRTKVLPGDGDILHHHFCPYSHASHLGDIVLPDEVKDLLRAGAKGNSLQRLILHGIKNAALLREFSSLLTNIASPEQYKLSGLLIQAAIWFEQYDNVVSLLKDGVAPENFWQAPFIPTIVPNPSYSSRTGIWPSGEEGEYCLTPPSSHEGGSDTSSLLNLKLSFVQDWRAEWNDGENPAAQFRAGLHLTPEGSVIFARAANNYEILTNIMADVVGYLPVFCNGPDLNQLVLISHITMAGYEFQPEEKQHLQLKYLIDWDNYNKFESNPKPLKHLCRLKIRFSCTANVYHSLEQVTYLPKSLKDYLLLEDNHFAKESEQ